MENRTFEEKTMAILNAYSAAMKEAIMKYGGGQSLRNEQDRLGKLLEDKLFKLMEGE